MSPNRILGIDLGTTNSCVAIHDGKEVKVIANKLGDRTTPSVVALRDDGDVLVGVQAKRQAITNPKQTLFGVKRLIGRKFNSPALAELSRTLPYEVSAAENGDAWIRTNGRMISPPEISAHVIRELTAIAEERLQEPVREAIITVPAYFDDAQRQATKDAGRIAGLEVRALLNEPTAAALAFGVHKSKVPDVVAVFDLGGGTFDVSILRIEDGVFEVLATSGDTFLGGEDFDRYLIEAVASDFKNEHGIDLQEDLAALQRLKGAVENVKHELSSVASAQINLPFVGVGPKGPVHLKREVARKWFESLTERLLKRLEAPCLKALEDANLTAEEVGQVVLVGGMTRMPAVQEQVVRIFGKQPSKGVNPDEIVAVGAATQSAIINGAVKEAVLLDVTSHSLGIRVEGDRFSPVIARNSTIPARESKVFATTEDNQEVVILEVYQGDSSSLKENRLLGKFVLGDLVRAPAGAVQVQVSFTLDADGILCVNATETRTGRATSMKILASSGLSAEEVSRLAAVYAAPAREPTSSERS